MTIIRAILLLLNFSLVPLAIGRLITYKAKSGLIAEYLIGFFGNLGIFYIIFAFCNWYQVWNTFKDPVIGAFSALTYIYIGVISVLVLAWLWFDRKAIKGSVAYIKNKINCLLGSIRKDKFVIVYIIVFTIILAAQLYFAFKYQINQWSYDDYDYVVSSKDTVSSDTLTYVNFITGALANIAEKRAATSWVTYIAFLSRISNFEVTTLSHTLLPVLLVLIAYLTTYYIVKFLFKEMDNRLIAMILISLAYVFGLYSHYSNTFRLLGAVWQGKAVLTAIAIPFMTVYIMRLYAKEVKTAYMLPIAAVSLGACSLTILAGFFVSIVACVAWFVMCIYHRRIYGLRYLAASLFGPAFLGVFYLMLWMLQKDMQSFDFKYFKFRKVPDT